MLPAADNQPKKSKALIKALVFLGFIITAVTVVRLTPVRNYLTAEMLSSFLQNSGYWAPLVYIILYAVGVCLFLPGTLLTNRTNNQTRYGYLNFSWKLHGTMEFRALPTFRDASIASAFASVYLATVDKFLTKLENEEVLFSTSLVG